MSELKTYTANVFMPGCLGPVKREVVLADDALAREAALREELAKVELNLSQSDFNYDCDRLEMRKRLTAAEQRNAELETAIKPFIDYAENAGRPTEFGVRCSRGAFEITREDWQAIAALKPTESGASDRAVRDLANDIIDGALSGASE